MLTISSVTRTARRGRLALVLATAAAAAAAVAPAAASEGSPPHVAVVVYDDFGDEGSYALEDYQDKWSNPYGLGEMAAGGARSFENGAFTADATPFTTGADFSVYDHIKYLAISTSSFAVPEHGSVEFAADIAAETPGTEPGRVIHGTYGPPGSYPEGAPYAAATLEGQQAGATLHMIDFATGQLFDWFVSGSTAFTLVERLPSSVTGSPDGGTRDTMYTQIVDEVPLSPGEHTVAIRFTRTPRGAFAQYLLDGELVSVVQRVGIPLDVQHVPYTGLYPSLGSGELLADRVDTVAIGHGLFSLLDAFPFQHPDVPELSVSIPLTERLFGQGARATFDNVVVTTTTLGRR